MMIGTEVVLMIAVICAGLALGAVALGRAGFFLRGADMPPGSGNGPTLFCEDCKWCLPDTDFEILEAQLRGATCGLIAREIDVIYRHTNGYKYCAIVRGSFGDCGDKNTHKDIIHHAFTCLYRKLV